MNATVTAFRALVRKDLLVFVRDRRAVAISVLTPILIAAFFGYLFGGSGDHTTRSRVPVAIVDQDASPLSGEVLAGLAAQGSLATEPVALERARELVRTGKVRAAVVLPPGFGADARRALFGHGPKPAIGLLYDPSQSFARPIIEGLLTQQVMEVVTRELFSAGAASAAPAGTPASAGLTVPFTLDDVAVSAGPVYNGYAHSFAGMSVQFILFMGIDAGVAILMQRQQGVWRRLRAAPLSRGVLLGARATATALIALGILAAIYLVAWLVFGVRIEGSAAGFGAMCVSFALFTAAFGLLIAAIGKSVAATRGLATVVVLLLVMLGGAWVPSFAFPEWMQRLTRVVPTRWAVDGFDAMTWRGLPFEAVLLPVAGLLAVALVLGAIAVWRFDLDAS